MAGRPASRPSGRPAWDGPRPGSEADVMPPGSSRIRASDADRDRVAALLQEHHAEGRLSAEEFSERLDIALHARTMGELDELLAELPHVDRRRYQIPDAGINPRPERLYA